MQLPDIAAPREQDPALGGARASSADTGGSRDFSLVVAPLALILIAYPAIVVFQPGFRGPLLAGVSAMLIPFVFLRLSKLTWPAIWLLLLAAMYAMSSWFEPNPSQGYIHTLALISTATTFLIFAIYGSSILRYTWVRFMVGIIVPVDLIAIYLAGLPKNATGGAMAYVVAIGCVVALRRPGASGWRYAAIFFFSGVAIALTFGVRSLIIYSAVFVIAFFCASRLPRRLYYLAGIAVSTSLILATVWFFVNIESVPFLAELSARIREFTGERANSGRDILWPRILRAVSESPIFGLGAGMLPRDIIATKLSSHNYYLQVYLQIGIMGLAALVAFLLVVWRILTRATTSAGRFGSALFLVFVVHNGTEVLMFQNQTLIGVPAWCAIGMAIAIDRNSGLGPGLQPAVRDESCDPQLVGRAVHKGRYSVAASAPLEADEVSN